MELCAVLVCMLYHSLCLQLYVAHRDVHVLTHSFPTRRSSELSWRKLTFSNRTPRRRPSNGSACALSATSGRVSNRSEEHTSVLQSLMRNSDPVFCLKTKTRPSDRHRSSQGC